MMRRNPGVCLPSIFRVCACAAPGYLFTCTKTHAPRTLKCIFERWRFHSRTHNALSDIITYLALNVGHRQQSGAELMAVAGTHLFRGFVAAKVPAHETRSRAGGEPSSQAKFGVFVQELQQF